MNNELIKVNKLDKFFGGIKAVKGVSFNVSQGEILGLIGPNGAGKTTLFNTICGVYKPTSGQIIFKDKYIQGLSPFEIARLGIARTFQIARPFLDMTVLENVLVGMGKDFYTGIFKVFKSSYREPYLKKAREILEIVDMDKLAGSKASDLSLGFKRRLGIARALAIEPEVLMLDEPLAGLSTDAIQKMLESIALLKKEGKTVIIIEHNMDAIMQTCDRIIVLNQGNIIAKGLPDDIQNNEEVIEAYLGKDEE